MRLFRAFFKGIISKELRKNKFSKSKSSQENSTFRVEKFILKLESSAGGSKATVI